MLLVTVSVCVYLTYFGIGNDADKAISEMIALPYTATDLDLERDGFINLSYIQEGRLDKVNSFFSPAKVPKNILLKTFYKTGDDLIACVFVKNDDARLVFMTSYSVKTQTIKELNRSFHQFAEEVNSADSITEVWLRGRTFSVHEPDGEDFLLYRYKRLDQQNVMVSDKVSE